MDIRTIRWCECLRYGAFRSPRLGKLRVGCGGCDAFFLAALRHTATRSTVSALRRPSWNHRIASKRPAPQVKRALDERPGHTAGGVRVDTVHSTRRAMPSVWPMDDGRGWRVPIAFAAIGLAVSLAARGYRGLDHHENACAGFGERSLVFALRNLAISQASLRLAHRPRASPDWRGWDKAPTSRRRGRAQYS